MLPGCSKGESEVEEGTPRSIILDRQRVQIDSKNPLKEITIIWGNGDYEISFPKKMSLGEQWIDYSEAVVKVTLEDDKKIVLERTLLNDEEMTVHFLLTDRRGERRVISAFTPPAEERTGDMWETEDYLLNTPDYWQD